MLLTLVLGITVGVLGLALIRQFLDDVFASRPEPAITAASFPRLAPPTRVPSRPSARPMIPARRAA